MSSSSETKHSVWGDSSLTRTRLGDWRKYLENYGITEERYLKKLSELKNEKGYLDTKNEAVWRLIFEINLDALHAGDVALMESTFRTMAVMTYDSGEDPRSMIELSMQYQLIQLDDASSYRTKFSLVELVPGCAQCSSEKRIFDLGVARALIPTPCKQCHNRKDKLHSFGLCECSWRHFNPP
jgi:hypothetical protein